MADQALFQHIGDHAELVGAGNFRVNPVQLPKADLLKLQPSEAHEHALPKIFGPPHRRPDARTGAGEPAFGGDEHVLVGGQRLGDEILAHERTIAVGGVDEVDAQIRQALQQLHRLGGILRLTPDSLSRDAHRAESQAIDLDLAADAELSGRGGGQG